MKRQRISEVNERKRSRVCNETQTKKRVRVYDDCKMEELMLRTYSSMELVEAGIV